MPCYRLTVKGSEDGEQGACAFGFSYQCLPPVAFPSVSPLPICCPNACLGLPLARPPRTLIEDKHWVLPELAKSSFPSVSKEEPEELSDLQKPGNWGLGLLMEEREACTSVGYHLKRATWSQ